ncbi:MAG: hypothetical protein AAFX80_13355 [Cyanobacteria bacterium J06639_18]
MLSFHSGVRSQESGVRSQESGVRSQESEVRGQESVYDFGNTIQFLFLKSVVIYSHTSHTSQTSLKQESKRKIIINLGSSLVEQ